MAPAKKIKFKEKVYSIIKKIPKGKVSSYKEVARALNTKAYRAVGNALNKNEDTDKIPCFKIVKNDGNIGSFSKGVKEKIRRLKKENIEVEKGKIKNFKKILFRFS